MVFGATDKTPPRRESFPARAPPGHAARAIHSPGHTARPAHRRGLTAPDHAPRAAPPSPRFLPGCHSARDDGPELRQRSPVDTEIALALAQLGELTDRLLATADALTDAQAAAPSRLPGWTRGHVLTHLARNADGFRNLLAWAAYRRRDADVPQRGGPGPRCRGRAPGGPPRRSAADLRVSAAAFAAAAQDLPARAWDALVARRGVHVPGAANPAAPAGRAGDPSRRPGHGVPAGRLARRASWRRAWPGWPAISLGARTRRPASPARMAWTPSTRSARAAGPAS